MRKYFFTALLSLFLMSCEAEVIVTEQKVPAEIAGYLNDHFPANPLLQVVKGVDGLKLIYDITLKDGIVVEFNKNKKVISIESTGQLPGSVLPSEIAEFVAANYPANYIIAWEKDSRNQQLKLDNGLELEFNRKGELLRIDS
jgi:uncharacterized protein YuzE